MRWKVLGLIVFAILIAGFTLANTTDVTVNFVFTKAKTNLVIVILLSVLLGMILMAILWSLRALKLRGQLGGVKKQLAQAQTELQKFRDEEAEANNPDGERDNANTTSAASAQTANPAGDTGMGNGTGTGEESSGQTVSPAKGNSSTPE